MNQQEIKISNVVSMTHPEDAKHSNMVETVKFENVEELSKFICSTNGYTAAVFKDNHRKNASFLYTQIIGLDVDGGLTLEEAIALFRDQKHIIATTRNHQKIKNKGEPSEAPACDRFRVILFLEQSIDDKATYELTWDSLFQKYPFIDIAAKDPARLFFKSKAVVSINQEGALVPVVKEAPKKIVTKKAVKKAVQVAAQASVQAGFTKGRLSLATRDFLQYGAEPGSWNVSLFKAAKDMQEQGYSLEEAIELFESMQNPFFTGTLDASDLNTIQSAFKVEPKYAPRSNFPVLKTKSSGEQVPDPNHPDNLKYLVKDLMNMKPALNELKNRVYLGSNTFNDADLSNVRLRARELNLNPSKDFIEDVVSELGRENSFHPFKKAIENTPWDEHDHITDLFNTMEIEEENIANKELYFQFLKRWLVGVVAKVYQPGTQNLTLVFKGAQGRGKSRWIEKLAIADEIFGEGSINPENKDDVLRHLNYVIWHASELDGITRKRDQAALKDYLTKSQVATRESYGRYDRVGKSVLSFCASVNEDTFLQDQTGNRRFLVIPISSIDSNHNVNMQQVFAQAKRLYEARLQYWFDSSEIEQINKVNESYVTQNHVDYLASRVVTGSVWLSGQELFGLLDEKFKYNPGDLAKLGLLLKKKGIQSKRSTVNGTKMTVYQVTRPSFNLS